MENKCHGCKGNGWVSPNSVNAVLCPVCNGTGMKATYPNPYAPMQLVPLRIGDDLNYLRYVTCNVDPK